MPLPETIGRYELLGPIGSGGMGTVLRARDPKIGGRTVAIKLLKEGIDNDEIRRRFMQEANAAGVLEHENIVRIFDVGEQDGKPFIAMEYIDGETLSMWIRRREPASYPRKLRLLEELCDGLAYAHSFNIVHRDIKPSNLIVEKRRGRLKILDFGIAKLADSGITNAGALIGSFNYMSPEQLRGLPIDHRSDIFSVGAVMFELISYKQAFPGGLGDGVLGRIAEQPSPRLRQVVGDADPEIEQIILKALEKDPARRYPDLPAMHRDLTRVRRRLEANESDDQTDAALVRPPSSHAAPAPPRPTPSHEAPRLRREGSETLAEHLADARGRVASGDLDGAAACLERASEVRPEDPDVKVLRAEVAAIRTRRGLQAVLDRARAALESSDIEGAIRASIEAELYAPGNPDARAIRQQADARRAAATGDAASASNSRGPRADRVRESDTFINRGKQAVVDAMMADATARFEDGDYAAAIVRCDAALRLEPAHGQLLRLRREAVAARLAGQQRQGAPDAAPAGHTVVGAPAVDPAPRSDATMLGVPVAGPTLDAPPSDDADHSVLLRAPVSGGVGSDAVLVVTECPDASLRHQRIPVSSPRFAIGRDRRNELCVSDRLVSRTHIVIELADDEFVVRDAGSGNGTYLNGRRLSSETPESLQFGATLRLGATVLTFAYGRDSSLPDLTRAMVENRYVLERRIRQSMQGAVYAARDRNTQSQVAVKLANPDLFRLAAYRRQFQREVEMVSQLDHPHISRVIDSYSQAEVRPDTGSGLRMPAICYVLFDGGTLQDMIDAKTTIAAGQVGRWVVQLADALTHAHERQILHGNLKPTAIVFDRSRTHPYLTDFAIAHRLAADSGKPPVAGTPTFMAPEQWEGQPLTPAVDQFGLAAVAYYLITGLRPFEAQDNPVVRQRNFLNGAPAAHDEAARNGRPEVPVAVSAVLRRALATRPDDRFGDVAAFAAALDAALRGHAGAVLPRVFFSYRREVSAGWVWSFAAALRDRYGIESFVDVAQVDRAVRFPAKLEHEIRTCDVFVCFLTNGTLQSDWVRREIQLACQYRRPMVPVVDEGFVRPADIDDPSLLELLEYDFVRLHGDYVTEAIDRLATRITRTCASAARQAAPERARGAS